MFVKEVLLSVLVFSIRQCYGEFVIPEVTLEAYDPKGFRASIPALDGIQMFAFHANINKGIQQVDPGDYSGDFTSPSDNNMWSYYNADLKLNVGDKINFWIFIQHDKLGYRRDNQEWTVKELIKVGKTPCENSMTQVSGKTLICKNSLIFEDDFSAQSIDTKKWFVEQYIPTYKYSLDYEFVSYQNKPDVCYVSDNQLFIKPQIANDEKDVSGELDLRGRCTRKTEEECYHKREIFIIVPPVTSGRIVSNFKFRYGKIEIKAKLPSGDWIFPQLYLEQVSDPKRKLWIAYARGNDKLLASNQEDIGGKLLFGGLVLNPEEPERSQYLKSKANDKPFTSEFHIYTVTWQKEGIWLEVDGANYGHIDKNTMKAVTFSENDRVHIVLGVGVGGINDFPDDFRSGTNAKPWRNKDNKQVKNFFSHKNDWVKTWKLTTDNRALQIEYVKVWAI